MIKITAGNGAVTTAFEGRVIEVRHFVARRNHSDTLDYTDFRDTDCTEALVWLGTHGVPGKAFPSTWDAEKARELAPHEQFAWVDCTNLFAWRTEEHREATVDVHPTDGKQPLLWANKIVWENHVQAVRLAEAQQAAQRAAEIEAAAAAESTKRAARAAKKAAKESASKATAEVAFARVPAKGTVVTVDGFTGTVFWRGVTKYRGTYAARYGVKDRKGVVKWCEA